MNNLLNQSQRLPQNKPPLLDGSSIDAKRAEIKAYFQNTWFTYDALFDHINCDSAYYLRPEELRHPLIFYFGHTATFYINKLILGKYITTRINNKLEAVCAVGVDEMSWDDLNSEHYDWPKVTEVKVYRQQVFQRINKLIDTLDLQLPIKQDSLAWVILMGCEHERIHLETSSVIMRMLPLKYLTPSSSWNTCDITCDAPLNSLLAVPGEIVVLGKCDSDNIYGWDNEYGRKTVEVESFKASKYLVSNHEFMAFVDAGGYQEESYWSDEGKQWLAYKKPQMPRFWFKKDDLYFQRNLFNEIPLPQDWPVETNYLEAKAFCYWKAQQSTRKVRLPTEAEWYCLRDKLTSDLTRWQDAPGNINLESYVSSCPVTQFETDGFFDIIGNVWQWTESAIDGFEGFNVHPLYDDFSTPTFDGKHNLIKGGSWISTGNEAHKSSRYAFRRHFFQHAGFRYIESEAACELINETNSYETSTEVCQQLASHYGEDLFNIPNYPKEIAKAVVTHCQKHHIKTRKVLDLGCSVGRTSFELSAIFNVVDAVDFSARYIQHGVKLQQDGRLRYISEIEGDIVRFNEVTLDDLTLTDDGNKLQFSQGDACNLKSNFNNYDVILAQHIIEQSYDPKLFLKTIHQRLASNGLLIIVSDYHFNEDKTEKPKWLGGKKVNGENLSGFDGLSEQLKNHFKLVAQHELSRVLKENERNYHMSNTQMTIWQLQADSV
ncbi:MAG: 5-histidylcysteine sulfoxide synthase/putative 4-mercaptohistidine N1-methyltransferase [Alteromonadaceae bacterium]|jgi:5-histidylcysteine sulfoxide synthase/putative 4-mercaptohistidine N1-methyltranferase